MNGLRTLIVTLALFLFSLEVAYANEHPVITIAGIESYRPYSYTENNRTEGLYNDIIREIFRRTRHPIKIELMPFKRILHRTKKGDVTGMAGTYFEPDRGEFATFLKDYPLARISLSLFVLKGSSIKSPALSQLKGKLIGKKRGFIMSQELDSAVNKGVFEIKEVETVNQLIGMLLINRLDGFLHTTNNTLYYIDKLDKEKQIQLLSPPVHAPRETYIAFSTKALEKLPKTFVANVRKAFGTMKSDGTLKDLNIKHNILSE